MIIITLLLCGVLLAAGSAAAQSETDAEESPWLPPLNLSQSDAATNPSVVQQNGRFHLFWEDVFFGFKYAGGDGEVWDEAVAVRAPFTNPAFTIPGELTFLARSKPTLAADQAGRLAAFWVGDFAELQFTRTLTGGVPLDQEDWQGLQNLAAAVTTSRAVIGENGRIHLAYVSQGGASGLPVGVYYRFSDDGETWSSDVLLYESTYLRSLTPAQIRLNLDTYDNNVHATWDDPLLDRVFYARSVNNGVTWQTAVVVDQRAEADPPNAPGPGLITQLVTPDQVHRTWRSSDADGNCVVLHQLSDNVGESWSDPLSLPAADGVNCPTSMWLLAGFDQTVWLMSSVQGMVYLQVWDGSVWSEPLAQERLVSFTNPVNYRQVTFDCLQPFIINDSELLVFGCGSGSVDDIWVQKRSLANLEEWFPEEEEEEIWRMPETIEATAMTVSSLEIITDDQGQFHAFWIGTPVSVAAQTETYIFYAVWDGVAWSSPLQLFSGEVEQLVVRPNQSGTLYMTWYDREQGNYFFSRAAVERAAFLPDWLPPQPLPLQGLAVNQVNLIVGADNGLALFYTIPINEARGVYRIQSADRGAAWSEADLIFDGAAAGWTVIASSEVVRTADGNWHLLLGRANSLGDRSAIRLFYLRSENGGEEWLDPDPVAENTVTGYQMLAAGSEVYRVWQERDGTFLNLWHQRLADEWSRAALVPNFGQPAGLGQLLADRQGQPHFLQIADSTEGNEILQKWQWLEGNWRPEEGLPLSFAHTDTVIDLAAAANGDGELLVLLAVPPGDDPTVLPPDAIYFTTFQLQELDVAISALPTPQPLFTPTPEPTATAVPTPEPTPEPTPTINPLPDTDDGPPVNGIVAGVVPAAAITLVVFLVGLRMMRSRSA